ncbi:Cof-type HAD-IIB family hydrolase [[Limnothrix rosea] IAM M-220]|uniref:Cof-type HAD-IIB family hydrolase n=1 Tax=[Limnothrix rosea] IAM M-220 TaxID=454133 RepID=UPI0009611044|nr:Cof-type HAD-IIB family hydrolase [[Limnothrix rosea] IAM M-220]OKH14246.1 hydrolase [[Limnothrix rosea] IAM M-220]
MEDIRLLVLDIDGTISGSHNQVTPSVVEAIRGIQQRGIRVAIATGRMFRSARRFHQAIASDLPIIAYNGAWIQDPITQKLHRRLSVPAKLGVEILNYLTAEPWKSTMHLHVYHDDELYVSEINEQTNAYEKRTGCKANVLTDLREIIYLAPTKILAVCHYEDIPKKLLSEVQKRYTTQDVYCTQSTEVYVEFTCPTATKGQAVKFLTETILGLKPENIMAIGDNFNDREMLQYAGLGIAMGNAPEPVKHCANYVTSTVEEDGVAQAIAHFNL